MRQLDVSFPRNYECDLLDEIPGGERFYFPGASTQGGGDGPIVRVTPYVGDAWVGIFAYGTNSPSDGATGLFTFPAPDVLCVVARGDGYLVRADAPTDWKAIEVYPICAALPIAGRDIVVFVGSSSPVVSTTPRPAIITIVLATTMHQPDDF